MNQDIIDFYRSSNQFGKYLDMDFEVVSEGVIRYELEVKEHHLATPVVVHGGVIASLIDGAAGVAAMSVASKNDCLISTVELNINFLSPAVFGDKLTATGKVIRAGRRLIFAEAEIVNQSDEIIAKASGIFNAFPAEKAGISININSE